MPVIKDKIQQSNSATPQDDERVGPVQAKPELPEFTFRNVVNDIINGIRALIFDPDLTSIVLPLLFFLELVATKIIRVTVPYTEIDYVAYIEQIKIINDGELNYSNIFGGTGPLVYPAGHVWIYRFLNWVTDGTDDIASGQWLFGYLYLLTQVFVFVIYYRLALPPWVSALLILSKRLHSIYVLRLFNDCFTTLFTVITVLILQHAAISRPKSSSKILTNLISPVFLSLGISTKMNALLYLPGFLVVVYFLNDEILLNVLIPVSVIIGVQLIVSYKFLFNGEEIRSEYLSNAFNFKRKFFYKWTVNWKFLGEEFFRDDRFHKLLLILHVSVILIFVFTKWASKNEIGKPVKSLIIDAFKVNKATLSHKHIINSEVSGRYVVGILVSSNFVGVLFSRSLHYQFLSWYAWTLPFILYHLKWNFILVVIIFLAHELTWNVYPSTKESSALLLAINTLALSGYWFNNSLYQRIITSEKKDN